METETESVFATLYKAIFEDIGSVDNFNQFPQKAGDSIYLTDARILIELPWWPVPCYREDKGDGKILVNFQETMTFANRWHDLPSILNDCDFSNRYPLPLVERPGHCSGTKWHALVTCDECGGGKLDSWYPHSLCRYCHGTGRVTETHSDAYQPIQIGSQLFAARYLWIIGHLENVMFGETYPQQAVGFTFDGGRGCLMPTKPVGPIGN